MGVRYLQISSSALSYMLSQDGKRVVRVEGWPDDAVVVSIAPSPKRGYVELLVSSDSFPANVSGFPVDPMDPMPKFSQFDLKDVANTEYRRWAGLPELEAML